MKKILTIALVFIVSVVACVSAEDLDVQVISRKTTAAEEYDSMNFDNVTFSKPYKIKGYASITLLGFKFVNVYAQWDNGKGKDSLSGWAGGRKRYYVNADKGYDKGYYHCHWKESGKEAEFAWLKADILNLQKTASRFMTDITVKVIYNDEYEYDGWVRQFNYDYSKSELYRYQETGLIGWPVCLSPSDEMSITPMYKGHYAFGCTLPNFVVEDKGSPLRMVITIGNHKLTYHIRK